VCVYFCLSTTSIAFSMSSLIKPAGGYPLILFVTV